MKKLLNLMLILFIITEVTAASFTIVTPINGSSFSYPGYISFPLTLSFANYSEISSQWYMISGINNTFDTTTNVHVEQADGTTAKYFITVFVNDTLNNINSTSTTVTIYQTATPAPNLSITNEPINFTDNSTIQPSNSSSIDNVISLLENNYGFSMVAAFLLVSSGLLILILRRKKRSNLRVVTQQNETFK